MASGVLAAYHPLRRQAVRLGCVLSLALAAVLVLSGCGGPRTNMVPVARQAPRPAPPQTSQEAALKRAIKGFYGAPYRYGGTTPAGVDCSGLVQSSFHQAGINLPRTAAQQFTQGQPVARYNLRFGDVVFFNRYCQGRQSPRFLAGFFAPAYANTVCHNGIYIGNGRFIHASRKGVFVSRMDAEVWRVSFVGARRFLSGWHRSK